MCHRRYFQGILREIDLVDGKVFKEEQDSDFRASVLMFFAHEKINIHLGSVRDTWSCGTGNHVDIRPQT